MKTSKRKRPSRSPKRRSKFEHRVQEALDLRKDLVCKYERDKLPYTIHLQYKPDWTVTKIKDGENEKPCVGLYLEAKGRFDYVERRKALGVIVANPSIDLRFIFMRNQLLYKGSKMRYGDWCDKHNIKWSVFPELPI